MANRKKPVKLPLQSSGGSAARGIFNGGVRTVSDGDHSRPAMEGGGFYNRNSTMQEAGVARALPLWRALVEKAPLDGARCVIVDYASSQGQNSLRPIGLALDHVLVRRSGPVEVVHTDLPTNDFSALFETLLASDASYLKKSDRVFPRAIGRSYFDPILPPASVDLGWNSWSMHWLSRTPAPIRDHLYIDASGDDAARRAFSRLAQQDWRDFLRSRSSELKSGAGMLTLFVAAREGAPGRLRFWDVLWRVLADMKREGLLSRGEMETFALPVTARPLEEITAPFDAAGRFSGLVMEHVELIEGADPFWDAYQRDGDAAALGAGWANMARAVTAPILARVLSESGNARCSIDDVFRRFAAQLAADPFRVTDCLVVAALKKA